MANNVVFDHPFGFGIQVYDQGHGSILVNNTVVTSGHSGIVVGGSGGVSNILIRNNILAFNKKYGVQMDSSCPTGSVVVDTNIIYGNGDGRVEGGCRNVSVGHNIFRRPRLVDLARRNLSVLPISPAKDAARGAFSLSGTSQAGTARAGKATRSGRTSYLSSPERARSGRGRSFGRARAIPTMIQVIRAVSVLRKNEVTAQAARPRSSACATLPTNGAPWEKAWFAVRLRRTAVETSTPRRSARPVSPSSAAVPRYVL